VSGGAGEHTPGPWFCGDEDEGADGVEYVQVHAGSYGDETFRGIANVEADFDGENYLSLDDTTRANARLIAAAPELLEALEGLHDVSERLCDAIERQENDIGGESVLAVLGELGPATDRARAAIAKARGEA
jgi:hypothetical protein